MNLQQRSRSSKNIKRKQLICIDQFMFISRLFTVFLFDYVRKKIIIFNRFHYPSIKLFVHLRLFVCHDVATGMFIKTMQNAFIFEVFCLCQSFIYIEMIVTPIDSFLRVGQYKQIPYRVVSSKFR